jgi:hypothetical protein
MFYNHTCDARGCAPMQLKQTDSADTLYVLNGCFRAALPFNTWPSCTKTELRACVTVKAISASRLKYAAGTACTAARLRLHGSRLISLSTWHRKLYAWCPEWSVSPMILRPGLRPPWKPCNFSAKMEVNTMRNSLAMSSLNC